LKTPLTCLTKDFIYKANSLQIWLLMLQLLLPRAADSPDRKQTLTLESWHCDSASALKMGCDGGGL